MRLPSKAIIEQLRQQFPAGTQVELVRMEDAQAPPVMRSRLMMSWNWILWETGKLLCSSL